jgi:cytochrome c-type biogenesis protein CcmF
VTLDRYTVRYDGLKQGADAQKQMITAELTVFVDGRVFARMSPAKWSYRHHEDEPPTTEVDIHRMPKEDLYLILNGYELGSDLANIKVVINPLVNWVWVGFVLLAIGTVIAFTPDRAYALAAKEARSAGPAAGAVAGILLVLLVSGAARAQAPPPAPGPTVGGMAPAAKGLDLHTARTARERAYFDQVRCDCPDCLHSLNECGGECGPGVRRRGEIQALIDTGKSDEEITRFEVENYGQRTLRVPIDKGFNRLAWLLPYGALLLAVGGLVGVARRWTRKTTAANANVTANAHVNVNANADAEYQSKLDDALDELD